jgi:methionyl aminopeptidase
MKQKDLKKLQVARKRKLRKESTTMILIKTPEQIDGIRKSCQLAAATLRYLEPLVVPGISTLEINDLVEKFIVEHNATPAPLNYKGYPKACCTSINEVICHGVPSDKVILKDGDIINVDVTTILDGYYGDTSRMFAIGTISAVADELLKVTKECLDIGIQQVFPGNRFGNIGYEIWRYAKTKDLSVVFQFCGHGVGFFFFTNLHKLIT